MRGKSWNKVSKSPRITWDDCVPEEADGRTNLKEISEAMINEPEDEPN